VDCVLKRAEEAPRVEIQHFNPYRAQTLRQYPDVPVALERDTWIRHSEAKLRLESSGFGKPLFPGEWGLHKQRAFRDALADILPVQLIAGGLQIDKPGALNWVKFLRWEAKGSERNRSRPATVTSRIEARIFPSPFPPEESLVPPLPTLRAKSRCEGVTEPIGCTLNPANPAGGCFGCVRGVDVYFSASGLRLVYRPVSSLPIELPRQSEVELL
jgi:hypothetical protein